MARILDILKEFLKEVERDNPYSLILKGGTALSLYFFNHRDSEDLDFDADKKLIDKHKEIKEYFIKILDNLKNKKIIDSYRINKSGFASTNRYHINLDIKTYKVFHTKIDVDFVDIPNELIKKNNLNLYRLERSFISKSIAFINRKEFKDMYDIDYLIKKIDITAFKKKPEVAQLIREVVQTIQEENTIKLYKAAFRNVDLKFKNLKESELDSFIINLTKKLNIIVNRLIK